MLRRFLKMGTLRGPEGMTGIHKDSGVSTN